MSDVLLTNAELAVLRAVDMRPGMIASAYSGIATGLGEDLVETALARLATLELIRPSTIWRTGQTSWRITRAGTDVLCAAPARRFRTSRQLELGAMP